jgi:hypothetical protein
VTFYMLQAIHPKLLESCAESSSQRNWSTIRSRIWIVSDRDLVYTLALVPSGHVNSGAGDSFLLAYDLQPGGIGLFGFQWVLVA